MCKHQILEDSVINVAEDFETPDEYFEYSRSVKQRFNKTPNEKATNWLFIVVALAIIGSVVALYFNKNTELPLTTTVLSNTQTYALAEKGKCYQNEMRKYLMQGKLLTFEIQAKVEKLCESK